MRRTNTYLAASLLCAAALTATARQGGSSHGNFKTVDNPGGGQYVYGPMTGRGSLSEAIVYMLRQVHQHFGDRPDVGKFFQSRDGGSVAAFFTVTAKTQGNTPMAGLLIVAMAHDGSASTAVLYDEKPRFGTTEPAMMKSLAAVWEPVRAASAENRSAPPTNENTVRVANATQLTQVSGGDNSAAISLPADWHLTAVSAGRLTATGPHGEMVALGVIFQNLGPLGPDLWDDFVAANNQARRRNGLAAASFTVVSRSNLPGRAIQVIFDVDMNDGVGPRKGSARVGFLGPGAISVDTSNIPSRFAEQENATLMAVIRSYHQNSQVIGQLHQNDMNRIQADANRAQAQNAAINARREASNAAFDQHMDNLSRSSKITQDYILDRSVVRDNELSERGTLSNSYADALVRGNPDRFQIVPNQDLIKGKDY